MFFLSTTAIYINVTHQPLLGRQWLLLAALKALDWQHRPTQVFQAHFVLTSAQYSPIPKLLPRDSLEMELLEKKMLLVCMDSLSILLSLRPDVTCTPLRRPTPSSVNIPNQEHSLLAQVQCRHMSHMPARLTRTHACNHEGRLWYHL